MNMYFQKSSVFFILLAGFFTSACSDSHSDSEGRTLPSDEQVIADVMPKDKDNVIDIYTTKGKNGEAYLNQNDLVWYFDRGVVVKRKKKVAGAPNAVVVVSGLARYLLSGESYTYRKFLVTDNSYEGIPAPSEKVLLDYVNSHLLKVFNVASSITEISLVAMDKESAWTWHTTKSFTVPFIFKYKKITSYTRVDTRRAVINIRFYRKKIDSPISGLVASGESFELLASEKYKPEEIRAMKTLADGF